MTHTIRTHPNPNASIAAVHLYVNELVMESRNPVQESVKMTLATIFFYPVSKLASTVLYTEISVEPGDILGDAV